MNDLPYNLQNLDPLVAAIATVAAILFLVWAVLSFLAPFFWFGTYRRAREISLKMDKLIKLTRSAAGDPPS